MTTTAFIPSRCTRRTRCLQPYPFAATLTPEHDVHVIVWRYAIGCIDRLSHRMGPALPEYIRRRAEQCAHEREVPIEDEVRAWFPGPFQALRNLGLLENGATMLDYWRLHHNHQESPCFVTTVTRVTRARSCRLYHVDNLHEDAWWERTVLNVHRLHILKYTKVIVHAGIIVEVAPPELA